MSDYLKNYNQNTDILIGKLYIFLYKAKKLTLETKELCPVFITSDDDGKYYNILQRSVGDSIIIPVKDDSNTLIDAYHNEDEIIYNIVRIIDCITYDMQNEKTLSFANEKIPVASTTNELKDIVAAFESFIDTEPTTPEFDQM